jgi:hypothetical protein
LLGGLLGIYLRLYARKTLFPPADTPSSNVPTVHIVGKALLVDVDYGKIFPVSLVSTSEAGLGELFPRSFG